VRGIGTIVNVAAVVAGTGFGLVFRGRLPDRMRATTVQAVGITVVVLGVRDASRSHNMVFPLLAVVLGGLIGEGLRIEDRLDGAGAALRRRYGRAGAGPADDRSGFVTGFVNATLVYCVGPLTILGCIEDGTGRTPQLLLIKSALDGFMSVIFAATYGVGVAFSAISLLVVQGLLTLAGSGLDRVLDDRMTTELFAAGGVLVVGIGLRLLELKAVRVASLLPGLVLAPLFVWLFARPGGHLFQ
jgi:uncharacterized membrane protein YqgA involved in biofilm formation